MNSCGAAAALLPYHANGVYGAGIGSVMKLFRFGHGQYVGCLQMGRAYDAVRAASTRRPEISVRHQGLIVN